MIMYVYAHTFGGGQRIGSLEMLMYFKTPRCPALQSPHLVVHKDIPNSTDAQIIALHPVPHPIVYPPNRYPTDQSTPSKFPWIEHNLN
jgi:hypothetical protein